MTAPARPPGHDGGLSLRARVLAAMTLVAIVLVAAGAVVVRTTSTHLLDQVDEQLERASGPGFGPRPGTWDPGADPAAGQNRTEGGGIEGGGIETGGVAGTTGSGTDTSTRTFNTLYVGVLDGTTLRSTRLPNSLEGLGRPDLTAARIRAGARDGQTFTVGSTDGDARYRVLVHVDDRSGATVVTGIALTDMDNTVHRLVLVMVVSGAVLLGVLALITWWVLRLGVRPIKQMTSAATEIAAGDLSHRIPPAPPGTEAAELGDALNLMLGNIQVAFHQREASQDRLRRFVADASHELRTPVTTIRGYAELQRAGGLGDPAQLDAAMRRIEAESVRMGNLVGDLLQLARMDQGRRPRLGPVDLVPLLQDAAADFSTVHAEHRLSVDLPADAGPVRVTGDRDLLHQVVANLLNNAAVHTAAGTTVHLRLDGDDTTARIVVTDDGPGMSEQDASLAFERFHRADPSRTRASGGAGLGLSIVQAVSEAHGGSVSLTSAEGRGTEVTVVLPLADPAVGPTAAAPLSSVDRDPATAAATGPADDDTPIDTPPGR